MSRQFFTRGPLLLALLALLVAALGSAIPARAASGNASPSQAQAGQRVNFSASGFTAGEPIDLWITFPNSSIQPRYPAIEADGSGNALWSWDVPASAPNGSYNAAGRGTRSGSLVGIGFNVVGSSPAQAPASSVSPTRGAPTTTFTFSAAGFKPNEKAAAWVSDPAGRDRDIAAEYDPNFAADASGTLTWRYTAPADAPGGQWFGRARGNESGYQVAISFTVEAPPAAQPSRTVTPSQGPQGTTFTVSVAGLKPNEEVGSWLNQPNGQRRDATPYLKADDIGGVVWSWTSPADAPAGRWQAVTRGKVSGSEVVLDFTVTGSNQPTPAPSASGSVSPSSGPIGTQLAFRTEGFYPGETVAYWPTGPDGVPLANGDDLIADASGRVSFSWTVPPRALPGQWFVTARGDSTRREAIIPFTVSPSAASPVLSASPVSAGPSTTFTFTANGYNDGERLDVWIEGPGSRRYDILEGAKADKKGTVTWKWTAPADAVGGSWAAVGRGQDTKLTLRGSFIIVRDAPPPASGPSASVSPARGGPGTTFTFTANGYERGERIGYWFTAPDRSIVRIDQEATGDRDGKVTITWIAPANAQRGAWTLAMRSSQSDGVGNDVSYVIPFTIE